MPVSCVNQKTDVHYEGTFLDENGSPELVLAEQEDGIYDVSIGIYRLTLLDDGIGTLTPKGLAFTATDAAGNPIGGLITIAGDTATVTFTDSAWPLLENGTSFQYTRQSKKDAILRRIRTVYEDVASRPYADRELNEAYCSRDWNETVSIILEKDSALPGETGFFESSYWVQGQDYADVNIRGLQLLSSTEDRAEVSFILNNLGDDTPMRLLLVKEEGLWKIDDFISAREHPFDWKAAMKEYLHND